MVYEFTDLSLEFGQYMKDSIDQIVKFFESNTAVSQTIALETAAAVQVLFDFTSLLFGNMLIVKDSKLELYINYDTRSQYIN